MSKTTRVLFILFSVMYAVDSSWQACNGKCYHLGDSKLSFDDINGYCSALTGNSKPVDFGSKLQQTLTTQLTMCRLNKSDDGPYWINRYINIQNVSNHDCRTVLFSGATVGLKTTPCSDPSRPFCETDNTSLCQTSNKTDTISKDWVRVAGQGPSFKLSGGLHTYCEAHSYCKNTLKGQMTREGNYSFMGLLASELGIKGQLKLDFWLDTQGISCLSPQSKGSVMQYTGPLVHMAVTRPVTQTSRVLCEKNVTLVTTPSTSTAQTTPKSTSQSSTSATTRSTALITTIQADTTSPSTPPATTQTDTTSPSTPPATTQTDKTSPTTQPPTTQTDTTSPSTLPATTQTDMTSPSTPPATTQTDTTSPSTPPATTQTDTTSPLTSPSTPQATTQTDTTSPSPQPPTIQTHTTSPTTPPPTTQTDMTSSTTQPPTTQTDTASPTTPSPTTQTEMTSPKTQPLTIPIGTSTSKSTATQLTQSRTTSLFTSSPRIITKATGPAWITFGQEEYFVNYNQTSYRNAESYCRDKLNASLVMFLSPIKYFTILSKIGLQKNSFWVGAHYMNITTETNECLSYIDNNMTMTTSPCHYEKFSVCSRILGGDISLILEDPGFKMMIQEMTLFRNETKKSIRKLTCAEDRRPSAQAAGGVGVFILCSVITLLLISDCSGIKSDFFNRKKKANSNSKNDKK